MRISTLAALAALTVTGQAQAQSSYPTNPVLRPATGVSPTLTPAIRTTVATDGSTVTQVGQTVLRYGPALPAAGAPGPTGAFVRGADGRLHACQAVGQALICN